MVRVGSTLVFSLLLCTSAVYADEDIDTENAKRHFRRGSELYGGGQYAEALAEFKNALFAKPLPEFHYNIAKCHDRLEHYGEAVAAYESYLAAGPNEADVISVRARIVDLKLRLERRARESAYSKPSNPATTLPLSTVAEAPTKERRPLRKRVGLGLTIAGAVVALAGGALLIAATVTSGSANSAVDLDVRDQSLQAMQIERATGGTLLGVGGATLIGGLVALLLPSAPGAAR